MQPTPSPVGTEGGRTSNRIAGALLIVAGLLFLGTVAAAVFEGMALRAGLGAIGATALLVGGTLLLAQRYSPGPDSLRRTSGISGMAIGTLVLGYTLQSILAPTTEVTGVLGSLILISLGVGSAAVIFGAVEIWSRRYGTWFQRKWVERERRRIDELAQHR